MNRELRQVRYFSPSMLLYGTLPLFRNNFHCCHALQGFVTSSLASPITGVYWLIADQLPYIIGASTSEPHSQELNSKSVTRDIRRVVTFLWACAWRRAGRSRRKPRQRSAAAQRSILLIFSLHVSPAKYMTSGRIEFPKLTHFSSAKYNTSGRIGFLYKVSMH